MLLFLLSLFIVTALLVYRHYTWKAQPWPSQSFRPPAYQGHRGFWKGGAQENTLQAFAAAKARGLKMVEMDVCLSKDHEVVVFHDSTLQRLANRPEMVENCTAKELREWAQAPTLREVLLSTEVPHFLNVELKSKSFLHGQLEEKVAAVVRELQAESRVLFSSFNPWSLWHLSRYLPQVPRALLATEEVEPGNSFIARYLLWAPYIKIHALHLDYKFVTKERLQYWAGRGVPVALWTLNDPVKAEEYLQAGALSIISDTLGAEKSEEGLS